MYSLIKTVLSVGILGLVVWGGISLFNHYFGTDYSKPWFKGKQTLLVCKAPYGAPADCYRLAVTSDGNTLTRLDFNNGGYSILDNSECYEAASFYNYDQFCSSIDREGGRWDFFPLHATF